MPISNIEQPEILPVDDGLRLRKFDDSFDFAFEWYQDPETVWLVDGVRRPYTRETLANMYHYLDGQGELYFIEALDGGVFRPIGDVCFWQKDMPIVIGDPRYRGRGIGRKVVAALVRRGGRWASTGWKCGKSMNTMSRLGNALKVWASAFWKRRNMEAIFTLIGRRTLWNLL